MIAKQPLLALLTLALFAAPTLAVQPGQWVHTNEADFLQGETEQTVVTNLGDLRLATGSETIGETPEETSIIYDLLTLPDGTTYLAAGPEGRLLKRAGDALETVLELEDEQVFALADYQGKLLLAISGEPSRLALLDAAGELTPLTDLPEVRYIWDVLVRHETLLLATGTDGKVLALQPNDAPGEDEPTFEITTVLDAMQSNILCLAYDAKRDMVYAGTDADGLIYRITRSRPDGEYESFVVFDAPEPEIGAILVARDGMVYAGTADAEQARPGRLGEAASERTGRPETPDLAPDEEDLPEPGDLPQVPPDAEPIGDEDDQPAPAQPEAGGEGEVMPEVDAEVDGDGEEDGDDGVGDGEGDGDGDAPGELPAEPQPAPLTNGDDAQDEPAPAEPAREAPAAEEGETEEVGVPQGAEPTSDQRDRLRALIRARLEAARDGGSLQDGTPLQDAPDRRPAAASSGSPRSSSAGRGSRGERSTQPGNAIYRIDPDGFVTEVFRESVMILKMLEVGDRLIVATGNEGQIFSVRPGAQETSVLVDLDPEQVPALLPGPDGALLLGTANPAQLVRLDERHANRGTYTSPALDASQISLWGAMRLTADLPEGTSLLIETRSGNVADPEQAPWSAWTRAHVLMPDDQAPALQPRELKVQAPPARFVQYRLTLTGNRTASPTVSRVELAYVMPNMAPRIRSVRAAYPEAARAGRGGAAAPPTPSPTMNIEWEASDPNEDTLRYRIEYRPADSTRYLQLADDVTGSSHEWNTRRVPDGRYVIRVIASDRTDNPDDMALTTTRQSNPVLVDNTAPTLENLQQQVDGNRVTVSATAVDRYSVIRSIGVAVNDSDEYRPVLPEDLIFDSTREQWSVILDDLTPGANVVTIRVQDARGNTHHQALLIDME